MTDQPYTDDDLRNEAAAQFDSLAMDPDFVGVGEMMRGDEPWDNLTRGDFGEAQRKIHDLIGGAADVGHWAITLGADGLQPENDAALTINAGDKPIARVLFAFAPDTDDDMRNELVAGLGEAIDQHL